MFSMEKMKKVWLGSLIDLYYVIFIVIEWKQQKAVSAMDPVDQLWTRFMVLNSYTRFSCWIADKNIKMWIENELIIPLNQTTGVSKIYLILLAALTTMLRGGASSGIFTQFSFDPSVSTIKYKKPSNPKIKRKFNFALYVFVRTGVGKKNCAKCQSYQLSQNLAWCDSTFFRRWHIRHCIRHLKLL